MNVNRSHGTLGATLFNRTGHNVNEVALEVVKDVLQLVTSHDTEVGGPGG